MTARSFDTRFGAGFLVTVPEGPGVYEWLDDAGRTLYVGKAANLRKRLAQYRSAGGRKKVEKKRAQLVKLAASVRFRLTEDELGALLLENELIQALKPPHNVSGAFSFMYPCLGVRRVEKDVELCCTSLPDELPGFEFAGAYRSKAVTRAAFDALVELLEHVGHVEPSKKDMVWPKYTRVVRFRRLDEVWTNELLAWWRGQSRSFVSRLVIALTEKQAARRHVDDTKALLLVLKRFHEDECVPLREVLRVLGRDDGFLAQAERDRAFLSAKQLRQPAR
ncbi:MAG: nucleotide excision repair endonuclease [Archangium sp.]